MVELLLVALLIPLIGFAIYANFNSGVKIWRRLHQQTSTEDIMIFTQKVSRNFETLLKYASIPFEGGKDGVSFAALTPTDPLLGGDHGICQVRFFYDPASKAIKRQIRNLSQIYRDMDTKAEPILSGVSDFKVSYFAMNKQDKTFEWLEEWADRPKELPVAVRFEFNWSSASGQTPVKKTFMIPAGGGGDQIAPA